MRVVVQRNIFKILSWVMVWFAFFSCGIWIRAIIPWVVFDDDVCGVIRLPGVYGMDYGDYTEFFRQWTQMAGWGVRHPLYNLFILPFTLVGRWVDGMNGGLFVMYLVGFFSAVMVGGIYLVGRILRQIGLSTVESVLCMVFFASFSYTWLLAACPESFGISCLLSLGLLLWGLGSERRWTADRISIFGRSFVASRIGQKVDCLGWGMFAFVMGGVTSSQLAKAMLAYAVGHRLNKRLLWLSFVLAVLLAVLGMGTLACRHGAQIHSFSDVCDVVAMKWATFSTYFATSVSVPQRFHQYWVFLSEPIVLRGERFSTSVLGCYSNWFAPFTVVCALGCAAVGAWLHHRSLLVKMIGAMFLVDFGLHFVLSWGMAEAQIYAGHWFYVVPLLTGCAFLHLQGWKRVFYAVFITFLSIAIFVSNVHAIVRFAA